MEEKSAMRKRLAKLSPETGIYQCFFNEGCCCARRQCDKCGWNPVVAKARLDKLLGGQGIRKEE